MDVTKTEMNKREMAKAEITAEQEIEYYENLDTRDARVVEPMIINKLRQRKQTLQTNIFDADILLWLDQQNEPTKRHVNDMLRHLMALQLESIG